MIYLLQPLLARKWTAAKRIFSNGQQSSHLFFFFSSHIEYHQRECPCGVMVKVMDCRIVVSKFELQSCYYIHFQTNTLGKGMNPPYPPSYGLNSTTSVLLGEWFRHWITYKSWYAIKQINQTIIIIKAQIPSTPSLSVTAFGKSSSGRGIF